MPRELDDTEPGPHDYDGHRARMISILDGQRRFIDLMLQMINEGDERWTGEQTQLAETVALMVQGAGVSSASIGKLCVEIEMSIRDCLGISRSVCETALNAAYIASAGAEARQRAKRHALQKAYRDINREATIGGFRVQVARQGTRPDPTEHPELEQALAEFTRKSGREITDWTPHSLSERIDVLRAKHGEVASLFAVAVVAVYRHSSELLHGTYFGTYYFWTAGEETAPATKAEMEYRLVAHHLVTVFSAVWLSLHGLICVLARELGFDQLATANESYFNKSARYVGGPLAAIEPPKLPTAT